ncbi:MAG: hypothetical protein CM1200mP1_09770 [Candidatus Neomarinimicrobiota bacterium]|nr:MAG: hypothetical protein CM1200mP1_09770 [Candidatus Neomarinimicrobiota bacterium]
MHQFINDDEEFVKLAEKHHVTLTDLRRPSETQIFLKALGMMKDTRVLIVGLIVILAK